MRQSDGGIRNGYTVKILNKTHEDRVYALGLEGLADSTIRVQGNVDLEPGELKVFADSVGHYRVFVTAPEQTADSVDIVFTLEDTQTGARDDNDSIFVSRR